MIDFECDYNNGAHPDVLRALVETNAETTLTYGADRFSEQARQLIRTACEAPDADVWFLTGGTQANATLIDGLLRSHEAVVCAATGHINQHEAGAVERLGHKVIALPQTDGRLLPETLSAYMEQFMADETRPHLAQPGLVYITFPTENGTLYSAQELLAIRQLCLRYGLKLYVDGARLGYGLTARGSDVSLPLLASVADAFTIGGTKVGALSGEAVVVSAKSRIPALFSILKQHGAVLAKGRLHGVQFGRLFSDGLYFSIARHANQMAQRLKTILQKKGFRPAWESETNQQFFILAEETIKKLSQEVRFDRWERLENGTSVCRFVTSWSTTEADLQALEAVLAQL